MSRLQNAVQQLKSKNQPILDNTDRALKLLPFEETLFEAYTFFPKSEEEISKTLSDFPHENVQDILNLFTFLKSKDKTPINIDLKKPKDINVSRTLKGVYDISDIKSGASLKTIRIKFGNGSSGNRGANNRGNAFETQFANAIEKLLVGRILEGHWIFLVKLQ